jgi:hypothetical protein
VGSSYQKWESHGKHRDNPGKQQYICHGTRDDIWALILESGPGWPDRPTMVRTHSDGQIWWKCLFGWVPHTETVNTCKTTKRGSRGQWELWNQNLVGQMDVWSDTCIMYGQGNLKEFASAGGSRKRICDCREKSSSSPQ